MEIGTRQYVNVELCMNGKLILASWMTILLLNLQVHD